MHGQLNELKLMSDKVHSMVNGQMGKMMPTTWVFRHSIHREPGCVMNTSRDSNQSIRKTSRDYLHSVQA